MGASKSILVYDEYDIWRISIGDTSTTNICLTSEFGKKNKIKYTIIDQIGELYKSEKFFLLAFNILTKESGFYSMTVKGTNVVKLDSLSMGDYYYHDPFISQYRHIPFLKPIKASGTDRWVVFRQSSTDPLNLFITDNFKNFTPLSNYHPEEQYQVHSNKLVQYGKYANIELQGLLYYPSKFDATKKYPVIVHFYEKKTQFKNVFIRPELAEDNINVQWFTSKDYIVFTPDIEYVIGKTGKSISDCLKQSANYLKSLSYIDSNNIGIQGHSFGGYETLIAITTDKSYKAAVQAAGVSNLLSFYGSLKRDGRNLQSFVETGQIRMKEKFWNQKDNYILYSPVYNAEKINCPLLMMHNKNDIAVPFEQGIEIFLALRRLNKPVWLLQYINEDHSLIKKENKKDYTQRIDDFFNYYLKSGNQPEWMK